MCVNKGAVNILPDTAAGVPSDAVCVYTVCVYVCAPVCLCVSSADAWGKLNKLKASPERLLALESGPLARLAAKPVRPCVCASLCVSVSVCV